MPLVPSLHNSKQRSFWDHSFVSVVWKKEKSECDICYRKYVLSFVFCASHHLDVEKTVPLGRRIVMAGAVYCRRTSPTAEPAGQPAKQAKYVQMANARAHAQQNNSLAMAFASTPKQTRHIAGLAG
jgi:hypothetical protein